MILSRSARSARLAPHFNLDSPRHAMHEPYWCYKHRRTCTPTADARQFLTRYTADTLRRIAAFAEVRRDVEVVVYHGDARTVDFGGTFDGLITSPPYPGRIDYHGQHRYAFELLGLADRVARGDRQPVARRLQGRDRDVLRRRRAGALERAAPSSGRARRS